MPARYRDVSTCEPGPDAPLCNDLGYSCGNLSTLDCFGHTGAQVLDTLHYSYDTISSKDERMIDLGCILAFDPCVSLGILGAIWTFKGASLAILGANFPN